MSIIALEIDLCQYPETLKIKTIAVLVDLQTLAFAQNLPNTMQNTEQFTTNLRVLYAKKDIASTKIILPNSTIIPLIQLW